MPGFEARGRRYHNPVEYALDLLGGKWKMPILWRLGQRTWRYGELRRDLKGITPKMLAQHLHELEADGFINRTEFVEVPPRVEYSLTPLGHQVLPLIEHLRTLGQQLLAAVGERKEG